MGVTSHPVPVGALVHLAGSRNPVQHVSHGEWPALHGPTERLGHGLVEVGDERLDALLEVRIAAELRASCALRASRARDNSV